MRRVEIHGRPPTSEEGVEIKKFHDKALYDPVANAMPSLEDGPDHNEQQACVKNYSYKGRDFLISYPNEHLPENIDDVLETAVQAGEGVADLLLSEFQKSGLNIDESELKKYMVSTNDILSRVIFNFDSTGEASHYEPGKHRSIINCYKYFDDEGRFLVNKFIYVFIHEMMHFVAYSEAKLIRRNRDDLEVESERSGFTLSGKSTGGRLAFWGVNEAMTELFTDEVYEKKRKLIDMQEQNPKFNYYFKPRKKEDRTEVLVFNKVLDYLAKYLGIPRDTLWGSMKRAYLEGERLYEGDVAKVLEECFGKGFVENFLKDFRETDKKYYATLEQLLDRTQSEEIQELIGPLENRWRANGEVRLKQEPQSNGRFGLSNIKKHLLDLIMRK